MNEKVMIEIEWSEKELEETSDVPVEVEMNEVALTLPRKYLKKFLTADIWDVFPPEQIMRFKVEDRVIWKSYDPDLSLSKMMMRAIADAYEKELFTDILWDVYQMEKLPQLSKN